MKLLNTITSFLIFLPALLGVTLFRRLYLELRILTIYLLIFSGLELIMYFLFIHKIPNLFLIHVFLPLEMALLSWVFYVNFKDWLPKYFIPGLVVSFALVSVMNSIFLQALNIFNTFARYIESLCLILMSLLYFYKVFTELKVERLTEEGMFWYSVGIVVYYAGTMALYISGNYILKIDRETLAFLYYLVLSICHLFLYSLFTLAIWKGQWKKT